MSASELTASLHRRLVEIEAKLLLETRRAERAEIDTATREDAQRRVAEWRARRDEVRALLDELRGG